MILFKKPNGNAVSFNSYRPISLASCVAKVKDLMIKRRLEWYVEKNEISSKSQYGSRRRLGTKDNLCKLMTDLNIAFSKNNYVVALLCDIKEAYDNIVRNIIIEELIKIGLPYRLGATLTYNIYERKIIIKINNKVIGKRIVYKGLPQGDILSPMLYSLYVRDIDKTLEKGTSIMQYADDILIYVEDKDLNQALNIINKILENYING